MISSPRINMVSGTSKRAHCDAPLHAKRHCEHLPAERFEVLSIHNLIESLADRLSDHAREPV